MHIGVTVLAVAVFHQQLCVDMATPRRLHERRAEVRQHSRRFRGVIAHDFDADRGNNGRSAERCDADTAAPAQWRPRKAVEDEQPDRSDGRQDMGPVRDAPQGRIVDRKGVKTNQQQSAQDQHDDGNHQRLTHANSSAVPPMPHSARVHKQKHGDWRDKREPDRQME